MQLSVIIPSFNSKTLLRKCLSSIYRETKQIDFEVIVVDNNSQDGSAEMVKREFSRVELIRLLKNLGFGKANNLGAKKARGKYLLFLNSDTEILEGAIDKVVKVVKDRVLGCRLVYPDGSFQQSAGYFPTLFKVLVSFCFLDNLPILGKVFKPFQVSDKEFYKREQEVDWVTGAFILVGKERFLEAGGFDEKIFMYFEEIDLCFRLKEQGARVFYTPQAKIIHVKGGSSSAGFEKAILGEYKGLFNFYAKYRPSWQLPFLKLILWLGTLLHILLFGIIDPRKRQVYAKAFKVIK